MVLVNKIKYHIRTLNMFEWPQFTIMLHSSDTCGNIMPFWQVKGLSSIIITHVDVSYTKNRSKKIYVTHGKGYSNFRF